MEIAFGNIQLKIALGAIQWGTIPDWLVLATVVVAVIYAIIQVGSAERSRKAELLLHFHQLWDSKELVDSRRLALEHKEKLPEELQKLRMSSDINYLVGLRAANLFEMLGFLLSKGYVKFEDLDIFTDAAANQWSFYKGFREIRKAPLMWEYFQKLAEHPGVKEQRAMIKLVRRILHSIHSLVLV